MLKDRYKDLWVRFHSLPGSKRYAGDESEYAIILERYSTVLCELFSGKDVYVITPVWTAEPAVPQHKPDADYWLTLLVQDDPDPEFRTYSHLFFARRSWRYGCTDDLLREVADDKVGGVLITDTRMERIHHPYDGGADVLLPTSEERDRLRRRHVAWLSSHPAGLLRLRPYQAGDHLITACGHAEARDVRGTGQGYRAGSPSARMVIGSGVPGIVAGQAGVPDIPRTTTGGPPDLPSRRARGRLDHPHIRHLTIPAPA